MLLCLALYNLMLLMNQFQNSLMSLTNQSNGNQMC